MLRGVKGGDARTMLMSDPKMPCAPRDLFTHSNKTRRTANDRSLARMSHGTRVQLDVSRQVEATLSGGIDRRDQFQSSHFTPFDQSFPDLFPTPNWPEAVRISRAAAVNLSVSFNPMIDGTGTFAGRSFQAGQPTQPTEMPQGRVRRRMRAPVPGPSADLQPPIPIRRLEGLATLGYASCDGRRGSTHFGRTTLAAANVVHHDGAS